VELQEGAGGGILSQAAVAPTQTIYNPDAHTLHRARLRMDNWILIVVIVVVMLAAGLLRERWCVLRVERWARGRGFDVRSPVPERGPQPAAELASCLTVYGARLWGLVLEGSLDGVTITIAENESSELARKTGIWSTIVTWPIPSAVGRVVMHRGSGPQPLAVAANAVVGGVRGPITDALGMRGEDKGAQRAYTPGGWAVYGDPAVRDPWLTHEKMRELDAWPHGGAFVREDGFGAWRVEGAISAGRLEQLVEQPPAMRCLLG